MKSTPFILILAFIMLLSLVACGDVTPAPSVAPTVATSDTESTPLAMPTLATATQDPTPQRSVATSTVMAETSIRATSTPDNSELPLSSGG